jgi:hypothetical protein
MDTILAILTIPILFISLSIEDKTDKERIWKLQTQKILTN